LKASQHSRGGSDTTSCTVRNYCLSAWLPPRWECIAKLNNSCQWVQFTLVMFPIEHMHGRLDDTCQLSREEGVRWLFQKGGDGLLCESRGPSAHIRKCFFRRQAIVVSHVYLDLPEAPRRMVFMSLWVEEAWV